MAMPVRDFKALSITKRKQKTPLTLLDFKEPSPGPNEVLIEVVVAAQNPIDWKQLDYDIGIPYLPWTNGGDVSGVVYKVGANVTKFQPGDRVISYLTRRTARHAGYQTYCLGTEDRTVKIPVFVSFEDGSTIPMAFVTAAAVSMDVLGMNFPLDDQLPSKSSGDLVLIWGGSGSVGSYAIQVAKWSGCTVITTASTKNFDYVKSFGADYVFDYHRTDIISTIRISAGEKLSRVFDTISARGSTEACIQCVTSPAGGTVAVVQEVDPTLSTPTIKVVQTGAEAANKPTVGKAVYGLLHASLCKKVLKTNRARVMPGGLLGVNQGFDLGRQNKISGEKLVYRIADTPI